MVPTGMYLLPMGPALAATVDAGIAALQYGLAAGLTEAEAHEVIGVVRSSADCLGADREWREVRHRMSLRAFGEEWKP